MKSFLLVLTIGALLSFAACGGGGTGVIHPTPANYTIGGTVSGLSGTVVLQDNGGNNLSATGNGPFTFTTPISSGGAYNVTVLTEPAGQICAVTSGTGTATANVSNVQVLCTTGTTTYTIGGTVSGLTASGLVLQNNGGNNLSIAANGAFTFTTLVASGGAYSVTVLTQPTGQTCTITNGSGTATSNVTGVQVTCATSSSPTYTISASVTGLTSGSLELQDNDGDTLTFTTNTTLTFATKYASGASYGVTPVTQPAGQNCTVSNSSG